MKGYGEYSLMNAFIEAHCHGDPPDKIARLIARIGNLFGALAWAEQMCGPAWSLN